MVTQSRSLELKEAIKDFEVKVDSPVSVENSKRRERWKSAVNDAFDRMRGLVERQRQEVHTKVFDEIASQEDSERGEIKQMRKSDARIAELMNVVKAHIASFGLSAAEDGFGPDLEDQVMDMRNTGLELSATILAQEEAVTSWFAESFDPDA